MVAGLTLSDSFHLVGLNSPFVYAHLSATLGLNMVPQWNDARGYFAHSGLPNSQKRYSPKMLAFADYLEKVVNEKKVSFFDECLGCYAGEMAWKEKSPLLRAHLKAVLPAIPNAVDFDERFLEENHPAFQTVAPFLEYLRKVVATIRSAEAKDN